MAPLTAAELSYQLGDLPDRATYLAAACSSLEAAIGADIVGWADLDLSARSADIWHDPPPSRHERRLFAGLMEDFPTVGHYRRHLGTFEPCRISDLVPGREWPSHRVYREFFRPRGLRHQLAIGIPPRTAARGAGWYLNRSGSDFTEDHVALARALTPVLAALYRTIAVPAVDREHARAEAGLTPRELDVLNLLAQGWSARQIATLRRISVRTVGKHLEHLYRKLGCNDRLQATNTARRLGLVP